MSILVGAGLIGSAIASMASAGINAYQNYKNMQSQQDVNETTWAREDNAVQRRVEDLKKAGLSPVLAAGSAASAQQVTAPHMDLSGLQGAIEKSPMNLMAMRQGFADIAQTKAQTELTNQQASSEQYKQSFLGSQMDEIGQRIKNMQSEQQGIDLRNSWYNADMSSQIGLRNGQLAHLAKDTLRIGQQTELLKAQTAYEQTAMDKLLTDIDNAKILRDINNFDLTTRGLKMYNDTYAVNKGALGRLFGDVRGLFTGFDIGHAIKNVDTSWYWDKK